MEGGMVRGMKGTERWSGGGVLELTATCCSLSVMGTDNLCHLEVEGPCAAY